MDNLLGRAQPTLLQELTLTEKLQVVIEQGGEAVEDLKWLKQWTEDNPDTMKALKIIVQHGGLW